MKGALLTIGGLLAATGIFAGMVLYTVSVLREYERQILTGDIPSAAAAYTEKIS